MIEKFRGENFFLSNMYPLENWVESDQGILVPTSEHAYQAAKFTDPEIHKAICEARSDKEIKKPWDDGVVSKEMAKAYLEDGIEHRDNWYVAKTGIMLAIVTQKFLKNPELTERLLATGNQLIVEGNTWGDHFWGVDPIGSDNGLNHLGQIHMIVRDYIREQARYNKRAA